MIFRLTSQNIKNLDSNQLKTIDYFEKRFGPNTKVLSLVSHELNPIQIIAEQDKEFQAFMSCRNHKGAYYLCSFSIFNKNEIIERSNHYLKHIGTQNLEQE
ncbi:MAG: hypothetical protein PHQ62_03440 [Clostridia bacterium]|nr:hypothetical protein [Clostridia bacterium]